jgi:MoaA/NifB/PqqE/SkfB family radical SAM enzyme
MNLARTVSHAKAALGILHGRGQFGGPVMGSISLTTRCNIRCIHCYYHSPVAQTPNFPTVRNSRLNGRNVPSREDLQALQGIDTPPAAVRGLIDCLLAMGTRRFQLSGFGEPMLHPEFLDSAERIKSSGSSCLTNTNGTMLTREAIDRLVACGFDELRVTTMAGTAEGYVRTHPGCTPRTFEKLRESLLYLAERKAARRTKKPKLDLVCIVIGPNVPELRAFAELAREVKADRVTFRPFNDVRDPGLATLLPDREETDRLKADLGGIRRDLDGRGISNNIANFLMTYSRRLDTRELYRAIPCYQGWVSTYIDPFGEVTACCGCSTPLGNIHEENFSTIWKSAAYAAFRHQALNLPKGAPYPEGCDCAHCVHHTLNLNVYRALHLVRGRSAQIRSIAPTPGPDGE